MLEKKEKHNSGGGVVVASDLAALVEDREHTAEDPLLLYPSAAPTASDQGPASSSYKSSFESSDHDTMRANFLPHPSAIYLSSDGSHEHPSSIKNSSSSSSSSGRRSKSKDSRNSLDDSMIAEEESFIQPMSAKEREHDSSKNSQTNKFSNYAYNTPHAGKPATDDHDEYFECGEKEDTRVDSPLFDYKSDENDDIPIIPGIIMHVSSDMDSAFEDESEERLFEARAGQRERQDMSVNANGNGEGGKRRRFASKPTSPPKDGRRHFRTFSSDYATNIKSFSDMVENDDTWSKYPDRHIPKYRRSAQALHNEVRF